MNEYSLRKLNHIRPLPMKLNIHEPSHRAEFLNNGRPHKYPSTFLCALHGQSSTVLVLCSILNVFTILI